MLTSVSYMAHETAGLPVHTRVSTHSHPIVLQTVESVWSLHMTLGSASQAVHRLPEDPLPPVDEAAADDELQLPMELAPELAADELEPLDKDEAA